MNLFVRILAIGVCLAVNVLAKQDGPYDYAEVLGLSLKFYEAQRCGKLPDDNAIPWRGDSFLNDGQDNGIDLEGGYMDAGDHGKYGFPQAGFATILGWGMLTFKDGYQGAGEYENGLKALKWVFDYLIKCHPSPTVLWANVGNATFEHGYWGRPEDYPADAPRPSYKIDENGPGSDLAGETAAAFASGALVFRDVDPAYSAELLRHAVELYDFANMYRGKYSDVIQGEPYGSYAYGDELLWGAAWLFRATREDKYLTDARAHWAEFGLDYRPGGFGWDDKLAGAQILLASLIVDPIFTNAAQRFCSWVRNNAPKSPKGLIFLSEWGSLRSILTVAYACLEAAEIGIDPALNRAMAKTQVDYALGDGGRSFVCGYGENPPVKPHHRGRPSSECNGEIAFNNSGPNPQTLYGALVGGPDIEDFYEDLREDYVKNEVALDYNSGFQSALAGLESLRRRGLLP